MLNRLRATLCAAGFLGFVALSYGRPVLAATQTQTDFLQQLHAINQAEIDAGKMAQSQGQSQAIKDYGKVLEDDHNMLDKRVTDMAQAQKVDLAPKQPDAAVTKLQNELNAMATSLKNTSKDHFDSEFARQMAEGHKGAIALVKKAEQTFKGNQAYEALAQGTLPVLQKHEDMAVTIRQEIRTTTSH